MMTLDSRFSLENHLLTHPLSYTSKGEDVVAGLRRSPKSLPAHYFYDHDGSQLFEEICGLPEYYPTRTETAILATVADTIATTTGPCDLIELGSGSSTKTRLLLDAYRHHHYPLRYLPVDVSDRLLEDSARSILADYAQITVYGLISTYALALAELPPCDFPRRLIIFLGSSLGNFTPAQVEEFFQQVYNALEPGDYFLLGVDLEKPTQILEAAYNDAQGVTAAFNLNCLQHLNWRFDGNFNLEKFRHDAHFNADLSQIEMHLVSQVSQDVTLKKLDLSVHFDSGERLLTEISRKFKPMAIANDLSRHGLTPQQTWTDSQQWFGLILCQRN